MSIPDNQEKWKVGKRGMSYEERASLGLKVDGFIFEALEWKKNHEFISFQVNRPSGKPYSRFYHINFITRRFTLLKVIFSCENGKVGYFKYSFFSHANLIQSSKGPVSYNFLPVPSIGEEGPTRCWNGQYIFSVKV